MSKSAVEDQEFMEEHLTNALREAWEKAGVALSEYSKNPSGSEMKVWFAEEAVEYSSLLFALTYELEDFDPLVETKGLDTGELVRAGVRSLRRAIDMRTNSPKEAYTSLRMAVTCFRNAHHYITPKRTRRSPRPSARRITRSAAQLK
jgi:8-oxo-dGTP pyrophosphatase MutT (NUDIX family)